MMDYTTNRLEDDIEQPTDFMMDYTTNRLKDVIEQPTDFMMDQNSQQTLERIRTANKLDDGLF